MFSTFSTEFSTFYFPLSSRYYGSFQVSFTHLSTSVRKSFNLRISLNIFSNIQQTIFQHFRHPFSSRIFPNIFPTLTLENSACENPRICGVFSPSPKVSVSFNTL